MASNWEVELGFNGKKVEKGLRDMERRFLKVSAIHTKLTKTEQALQAKFSLERFRHENRLELQAARSREQQIAREHRLKERAIRDEQAAKRRAERQSTRPQDGSPRVRQLSDLERLNIRDRIERQRIVARNAYDRIGNREDEASIVAKAKLERQLQRLDAAQTKLAAITDRNSKKFVDLRSTILDTSRNINALSRETRRLDRQFTASQFAVDGFKSSVMNMGRSYLSVFAAVSGFNGLVRIGSDLEDTRSMMLLASGSTRLAAEDMEFVGQVADKTAMRISDLSRNFAKFAVSGRGAGLTTNEVRKTFEDLSIAMRSSGLSKERADMSMLALQQMLAGPVIQAQEMNQIIEHMPQFTKHAMLALREMGYEGENYRNIIASGTVASKEFVQVVARSMKQEAMATGAYQASLQTVTAAQGRFGKALEVFSDKIYEAGLAETLVSILDSLGHVVKAATPLFMALAKTINFFVQGIEGLLNVSGELVEALGFSEGTGVSWVLGALGAVLTFKALGPLGKAVEVMKALKLFAQGVAIQSALAAAGITAMSVAIRRLLFATGVGAALAVAGYGLEKLFMSDSDKAFNAATHRSDTMSELRAYGNQQASTPTVNQYFNITQSSDPIEHARRSTQAYMNEMTV